MNVDFRLRIRFEIHNLLFMAPLSIKTLDGATFTVEMAEGCDVTSLKGRIVDLHPDDEFDQMRLVYKGAMLKDRDAVPAGAFAPDGFVVLVAKKRPKVTATEPSPPPPPPLSSEVEEGKVAELMEPHPVEEAGGRLLSAAASTEGENSAAATALTTVKKILRNLLAHPTEMAKYGSLRKSSAKVAGVVACREAADVLLLVGFQDTGDRFVLGQERFDAGVVRMMCDALEGRPNAPPAAAAAAAPAAMDVSNPFAQFLQQQVEDEMEESADDAQARVEMINALGEMGFPVLLAEQALAEAEQATGQLSVELALHLLSGGSPADWGPPMPALMAVNDDDDGGAQESGVAERKLVLVVNMGLGMGYGKIAAQCSHATLGAARQAAGSAEWMQWETNGAATIVTQVASTEELLELKARAEEQGLLTNLVTDAGRTEVSAGSQTVLAIGPAERARVDTVTGGLRLL